MSATLQSESISNFLNQAPIISVPGQSFPLEIRRQKESQLLTTGPQFIDRVIQKLTEAMTLSEGHILVFLPGLGEIERVYEKILANTIANKNTNWQPYKLYGTQSLEEQRAVISSSDVSRANETKKIILATNIAESSLTIDGVTTVIDTGLARINFYQDSAQVEELKLVRTSKSSQTQRAGRAARQGPGLCLQLWNDLDLKSMKDFEEPEILRCNLSYTLLSLSKLGITDFKNFSWYLRPSEEKLKNTTNYLQELELINKSHQITSLGLKALSLPLEPDMALLAIKLMEKNFHSIFAAEIVSLLTEKDPFPDLNYQGTNITRDGWECDLLSRWEKWKDSRGAHSGRLHQLQKSIQQVRTQLDGLFKKSNSDLYENNRIDGNQLSSQQLRLFSQCLFEVFSPWLSRRRKSGETKAITRRGRGVELDKNSFVRQADFFIALKRMEGLSLSDTKVQWASGISVAWIKEFGVDKIQKKSEIKYDREEKKFWALEASYLDRLPLEEPRKREANADEVRTHLPEIVSAEWDYLLDENRDFGFWWHRYLYFCKNENIEVINESTLQSKIQDICYGENRLEDIAKKDLIYFFADVVTKEHQQILEKNYPLRLPIFYVPKNTSRPYDKFKYIHYKGEQAPFVELKIQEAFGLYENQKIGNVALTYILLGPNYRPVQVTKDIAGFWSGSYIEIRKELKARYPKHDWPEKPSR